MIRPIASEEVSELHGLLTQAELPTDDLNAVDWLLLCGYFEGDRLVAAGGLERCGEALLLRSIVTAPDRRGRGLSAELIRYLHVSAGESGYDRTWLLTETAKEYFSQHHDYIEARRCEAPEAARSSTEFSQLCSNRATLMMRQT